MPSRNLPTSSEQECTSPLIQELQNSPKLEMENIQLERDLDIGEQHMEGGVAMATEESDAETVSTSRILINNREKLFCGSLL